MKTLLNIFLVATLLVIGAAILQMGRIIKRGKESETPDQADVSKVERLLNVIHIGVYALVVIAVFRIYLMFTAG